MKKAIPVIIAIVLILIIGGVAFGRKWIEKYSYGKEYADLDAYYGVEDAAMGESDGNLAIVLQDEIIEDQAVVIGGKVYFDEDLVRTYFNDGFYVDRNEQKLLYTSATDTVQTLFGEQSYSDRDGEHAVDYVVCLLREDKLYMAADYVKMFANFSYEKFDRHLQVYTEWGIRKTSEISKKTMLRVQGGIKSPILREMEAGERVEILEEMGTWSKVKTSDSMMGYVENKRLTNMDTEVETPVTDWAPEEYTRVMLEGKVNLGWHAIYKTAGNDSLDSMVAEGKGLNVIAPTWFSIKDSDGAVESFASKKYVEKAHGYGLKVWGVWDDFNYSANNGMPAVDISQLFSSTTKRQEFARNIVSTAMDLGLDGINLDFEQKMSAETREQFTQFLREMSVLCRQSGLTLSVDISVPLNSNNTMRLDVQGKAADYVIMMGYDEHWGGCGNPGSVASIGFVSDGLDRVLEHVPAGQVINALPFYTREWKTEGTKVTDTAIPICNLKDYLERHKDDEIVWDEVACQNYLEWQSGDTTYQIWLEDADSIRDKLNVMNAKKLGGVAVWRLGYGTKEIWEMVAAYAAMK